MTVRPMDKTTEYLLTRGYKFEKRDTNWVDILDEKRGIGIGVDYYKNETTFNCFVKSDKSTVKNGWEQIASTFGNRGDRFPFNVDKEAFLYVVCNFPYTEIEKQFRKMEIENTLRVL